MIKVIAFKGKGFISKAIRWQTRSPYSHVGILIYDRLFEAYHVGGVRDDRSLEDIKEDYDEFDVKLSDTQGYDLERWLKSKLGKSYDFIMVARFLTRRPAKDNNKYFCSELVMEAFHHAGLDLLNAEAHNVSPRDICMSPYLIK